MVSRLFLSLLPSPAGDPKPEETTARYLFQSSHFSVQNARVKPQAFHPSPRDHKTSVFRVSGLTEGSIWALADAHAAGTRTGGALARAEVSVAQVQATGLRVEAADPPPRHANIIGWPEEKPAWMSKAQELAAIALLRRRE